MDYVAGSRVETVHNPVDLIEEIATANEWPFERGGDDELVAQLHGRWDEYRVHFAWNGEISALQFTCALDFKVPQHRRSSVLELVALANERMWLGHFDLTNFMGIPGAFDDPRYRAAVETIVAACRRHGKTPGFMAGDDAWAKDYLGRGFRIIAYGVDSAIFRAGLAAGIAGMRRLVAP